MFRRDQQAQADKQAQDRSVAGRTARWIAALAGGAAVQYVLDPASGRTRRARIKDKVGAAVRRPAKKASDQGEKKLRVAVDKAVGVARGAVSGSEPPPNDQTLADKIRSEVLGADEFRDHTILVDCADGKVTLRGHVKRPEQVEALEAAVGAVDGVKDVTNLVHLPGTDPANIRAPLEASRGGRGRRPS